MVGFFSIFLTSFASSMQKFWMIASKKSRASSLNGGTSVILGICESFSSHLTYRNGKVKQFKQQTLKHTHVDLESKLRWRCEVEEQGTQTTMIVCNKRRKKNGEGCRKNCGNSSHTITYNRRMGKEMHSSMEPVSKGGLHQGGGDGRAGHH
jgi:hypothetical protein